VWRRTTGAAARGDATCSARTRCSTTSGSSARATAVPRRRRRELHDQRLAGDPGRPARRGAAPTGGRRDGVEYSLDHGGRSWFIRTNADGATNFKVVIAPDADPTPRAWADWAPHRDSAYVEFVDPFRDFVVVGERTGGMRRLRVTELDGGRAHTVALPEAAYGVFPSANAEYATPSYRVTYSSLVTPSTVYDYDVRARRLDLRKRTEVPTYDAARYEVRRGDGPGARRHAGAGVVLMRRGTALDGRARSSSTPTARTAPRRSPRSAGVLSLVDRGFVYALAHVRGGQEMGRRWYDQGKMLNKRNTFCDFEDVAAHLVRAALHERRPARGQRRQRRRAAHGRGGQRAPRPVPRRSSPTCRSST
jgi:oligopeptidase B